MTRKSKRSFECLTPDELLRVLKLAKERSPRDHAMVLLTYSHGMRAAEICNLTVDDLDLKAQQLDIRRVKGSLRTTQPLLPHRGTPLLDEPKAVAAWLSVRPKDSGNALFTSQKGGHLTTTQFYRVFRDIAQTVGLPRSKQHPHVLKHSIATHLIRADMNLAKVGRFMGHAAIASTMKYLTVSDSEASRDAQNALANTF
jgi:integrase/recombinase XerD